MNKMEKEIFNKAIQGYVRNTKKNIKEKSLDFSTVISEIHTFLEHIFDAIVNEKELQGH